MLIRDYMYSDRSACLTVFSSNVPGFFAPSEVNDFVAWLNLIEDEPKRAHQAPNNYYHVIEQNSRIAASGGFHIPAEGKPVTLVWGMVDHALHKQGLGLALLGFRVNKIEELYPGRDIVLDTTQHSYSFFEKYAFRTTKITRDYYAGGLDRYDMIRYGQS